MADEQRLRPAVPRGLGPARTPASDFRILVVDDDTDHRSLVGDTLRGEGYDVTVAVDGGDATRAARKSSPHVVFLDLSMPGISGWDALPYLKRLPEPPRIVALSAHGDARSRQRAFELGCDEFVAKPFTATEICGVVSAYRLRRES